MQARPQAVGLCKDAPSALAETQSVVLYDKGLGFGLASSISSLGNALGVVGGKN